MVSKINIFTSYDEESERSNPGRRMNVCLSMINRPGLKNYTTKIREFHTLHGQCIWAYKY
jgi:hypothetical protein